MRSASSRNEVRFAASLGRGWGFRICCCVLLAVTLGAGSTNIARGEPDGVTTNIARAESGAGATNIARAESEAGAKELREQRAVIKRLEADLIIEPARREWQERRELLRELARRPRRGRRSPGARSRPADPLAGLPAPRARLLASPRNPGALSVNVRMNASPAFWTQSEVSIAGLGRSLVAAWNDGTPDGGGAIRFAWSLDGGTTWHAGAPLPIGNGVIGWDSDPVFVADPVRGEIWFAALALAFSPPTNTIAVMRGVFADTGFAWKSIDIARATRDTLPDKPWLSVDPTTGALALSYTLFYRTHGRLTDRIELQRSEDRGASWTPPARVSAIAEEGLVQGSRPAHGPDGELHVVWALVDTSDAGAGLDHMRLVTSRDGGRSFTPPVDVARVVTNFSSGAPGFNRAYAINFPTIAVDRGDGPWRGRVYVGWMESANFYTQRLGARLRVRPRDGVDATPFVVGDVLSGVSALGVSQTRFRFNARRGQTAMILVDSLTEHFDLALGVGCEDNPFEFVYSNPPGFGRARMAIVTFPRDGEYVMALRPGNGGSGSYRIRTGFLLPGQTRGRDVRDVFVTHSDDGRSWSSPARVNETPPWYDDWLPELAVSPAGDVYTAWYDWRDSPTNECGARSNVYLARSADGGNSWQNLGVLSDRSSDWGATSSNLVPNQGDYIAIVADTSSVSVGWADARGESPDAYFARLDLTREPTGPVAARGVTLSGMHPNPARGAVDVTYAAAPGLPAKLELWDISGRRVQEQDLGVPAASGSVRFLPRPGLRAGVYVLRLVQGRSSSSVRLAVIP